MIGALAARTLASGNISTNHHLIVLKSSQSSDLRVGTLYAMRQARRVNALCHGAESRGLLITHPEIGRVVELPPALLISEDMKYSEPLL